MSIEVIGLTKAYQGRLVVREVDFSVAAGELLVLLGPSGSGKSTVLRMIGGLTPVDAGKIFVNGVDVTAAKPQARDMGFVFQSYALFEHMSVADNVEFALRARRMPRPECRTRRTELLTMVGLDGMATRLPSQLSGGQRQRAALARALAHQPQLLLLDEPFGALDARIRHELRNSLRQLLKRLGTTAIFVTHDQEEAFTLADRILVMHRGRVLESGVPEQLYRQPRTEFVASFLGRANLLPARLVPPPLGVLEGSSDSAVRARALVRPEDIHLTAGAVSDRREGHSLGMVEVRSSEFLGASERLTLRLAGARSHGEEKLELEVERASSAAELLPAPPGRILHAWAKRVHFVPHPSLRLLLLADADARGRQIVEAALQFGEHAGALVTVLGSIANDPALRARFEIHRQQYAGDLRLIDPVDSEQSTMEAALRLTGVERFDLAIHALHDHHGGWRRLLAHGGVDALLLPAQAPSATWPLGPGLGRWALHADGERLRLGSLQLLRELAEAAQALIDDQAGAVEDCNLQARCLSAPVDTQHQPLLECQERWEFQRHRAQLLLLTPEDSSLRVGSGGASSTPRPPPHLISVGAGNSHSV